MTNSAKRTQATDVFIVGLGIKAIQHLTIEAVEALRSCQTIFVVDHGFGVETFLRDLGPRIVNLIPEYQEGQHRLITYQRMSARVIDEALRSPPVAFAIYGHPNWLVFPAELIADAAKLLSLNVETIAGISCIDTLILELGIDPAAHGLQIFEASGMVISDTPINPGIPCVLLQVDAFNTAQYSRTRIPQDRLTPLVEHLTRFYPRDHECLSVYSSTHPLMKPIIQHYKIDELPRAFNEDIVSGTLFVPRISNRPGSPCKVPDAQSVGGSSRS